MIDRMGRKRALLGLTVMAVGALMIVSPASALAQDLTQTSVPDVTDTVGSTIDTATGGGGTSSGSGSTDSGSGGGGGTVGGTVGTVTDPVKDTVEKTGGTVGTVVDNTGGTVDKVAPGTPVGSTKKAVEDTVKKTSDGVSGAVSGTVDGVKQTTDGVGGGVVMPILNAKSPRQKDRNGDGKVSNKERAAAIQERKSGIKAAMAAERSEKSAADAKDRSLASLEKSTRTQGMAPVSALTPPPRETFLTQLADAAVEATKKLAFPLGLALMVGAFLMVQGRIDRKDAKLALAPIDAEQDLLSFQ